MIKEYDLSPDNKFLMTKTIKKPFSYLVPYYRFPYTVEVINLISGSSSMIADIPIDEVRPKGFDATRTGIRSVIDEIFLSVISIDGFSNSQINRSSSVTKYGEL